MKLHVLNAFHDYMWSFWVLMGLKKSEGDLAQQKRTINAGKS